MQRALSALLSSPRATPAASASRNPARSTRAAVAQSDSLSSVEPAAVSECSFKLGDAVITLETGRIGRQANGAVLAREGDTVVFTTICAAERAAASADSFLPLTVVYQERFSAAGRTASGFQKREGRSRDNEVLTSRCDAMPTGCRAATDAGAV